MKILKVLAIGVATAALFIATGTASAAPDPLTCTGYPESRIDMGAQDWWGPNSYSANPGDAGPDRGHLHMDVCAPYKQTVSGLVQFHVRVALHEQNVGFSDTVLKRGRDASGIFDQASSVFPRLQCSVGDCSAIWTFTYDTTKFRWNGWGEIVLQVRARADSKDRLAILDIPVYVNNPGKTLKSRVPVDPGAAGFWHYNYATAGVLSNNLPTAPVTAPVVFQTKFAQAVCSDKPDCQQNPVIEWSAHVDPDFHAGNLGTIIGSGTGVDPTVNITYDPALFPPGPHKIVLRSEQHDPFLDNTNQGLFTFKLVDGT